MTGAWYRLHEHGIVDSTSERAFAELAAGRARHGDAHLAREQTRGRGRLGRKWESPPGEGLYLSVVLLPEPPPPPAPVLTMAVTLALRDALEALGARGLVVKWPNDLLAGGAKLAGILVESRGLDPTRPHFVVGIGVNVRQRAFPPELEAERAVTSLALLGCDAEPREVAVAGLERLPARLEAEPAALGRDFLAATGLAGEVVRVRAGREELAGRVLALDPRRGLSLAFEGGQRRVPLELVSSLEALDPGTDRARARESVL